MSIRPVDLNGMVQRSQDVGTLKQQEDSKTNGGSAEHTDTFW